MPQSATQASRFWPPPSGGRTGAAGGLSIRGPAGSRRNPEERKGENGLNRKLKSSIWVEAQIRRCNLLTLPFYVVRRGDPDAGAVFVKLVRGAGGALVLSPARDAEGGPAWRRPLGEDPVTEAAADSWLERQQGYDPDLWIVEIEDSAGRWEPDEPIL